MKSILRHIRRHQDHHRHPYQNLCRDLSCPVLIGYSIRFESLVCEHHLVTLLLDYLQSKKKHFFSEIRINSNKPVSI